MAEQAKKLSDHLYLKSRDRGPSLKLKGDVVLVNVLVKDRGFGRFPKKRIRETEAMIREAAQMLEGWAKESGVDLRIRTVTEVMRTRHFWTRKDITLPIKDTLKFFRKPSIEAVQRDYEARYRCDEAPVVLLLDREARSYAYKTEGDSLFCNEMSVVFCVGPHPSHTYVHELLHQFGAVDLYGPPIIEAAAKRYFPSSIMRNSANSELDDLTKLLIGWTDVMTPDAACFLEETVTVTREGINAWQAGGEG